MKDSLLQIINHYGVLPQLKYFQSEVYELGEAIWEYQSSGWDFDYENCEELEKKYSNHIAEEIADVQVMLDQFQHYYGISDEEIFKTMQFKINRQLKRIESENDEILDDEKFEDIDLINLTYQDNHNQIEINEYLRTMLNQLIKNQKKIIEKIKNKEEI